MTKAKDCYQYNHEGYYVGITTDYCGFKPVNATYNPPIVQEGFIPRWTGKAWEQVEDHRGIEYWLPGDDWQTPARVMKEPGPLPDGAVLTRPEKPAPTLEEAKAAKIASIDAETSSAILSGFDYEIDTGTGTTEALHFSYDSFDQQNFADSATLALLSLGVSPMAESLPTSVTWNAYRDWTPEKGGELVRLTLDPEAFLSLYVGGALSHKATKMEEGGQRKAAVEAAITVEELPAI